MCGREGFTLVEVLVALAIFGMIAGAGVLVLSQSIDNRFAVRAATDRTADLQRMRSMLKADLAQATGRRSRGLGGRPMPQALMGAQGEGDPVLVLTRAGWSNPDGDARPSMQRVEYRLEGDRLERRVARNLDGAQPGDPQVLYRGVSNLNVSFIQGASEAPAFIATPDSPLPDAVRITMTLEGYGAVEQLFLVGGA